MKMVAVPAWALATLLSDAEFMHRAHQDRDMEDLCHWDEEGHQQAVEGCKAAFVIKSFTKGGEA